LAVQVRLGEPFLQAGVEEYSERGIYHFYGSAKIDADDIAEICLVLESKAEESVSAFGKQAA